MYFADWFGAPAGGRIESLAVLPLENLSGDREQEYFADGMTDALIAELSQIQPLKVISRTSVMQYKGAKQSLPAIGRALQVDAIVEGSVRSILRPRAAAGVHAEGQAGRGGRARVVARRPHR